MGPYIVLATEYVDVGAGPPHHEQLKERYLCLDTNGEFFTAYQPEVSRTYCDGSVAFKILERSESACTSKMVWRMRTEDEWSWH